MKAVSQFLERTYYGNSLSRWLLALVLLAAVFLLTRLVVRFLGRKLKKLAQKTDTRLDDLIVVLIRKTRSLFIFVLAVFCASLVLTLPATAALILRKAVIVALLLQAAVWGSALISFWLEHYVKQRKDGDAASKTTYSALAFVLRLLLWSLIVLLGLDNLGVNITALVTGLGIGGVAVALALQNILGDLFASLSIALDKPFVIGDFIVVDDLQGTVEHIGLKTTRVRSLSGEQLVFANSDLLKSRIRNFERMSERRVVVTLRLARGTSHKKLTTVPGLLRAIIEAKKDARFDRAHFRDFGDSSLDFEVVYWVLSADYARHMDVRQAINLDIARRFAAKGIKFAFQTQAVILSKRERA